MPASDGPTAGFACPPAVAHYLSENEMLSAPSPTRLSESGLLRRRFKSHRSSKKSVHAYSDYGEADTDGADGAPSNTALSASVSAAAAAAAMGPRSISLTALHANTTNGTGSTRSGRISAGSGPLLEPRMAQLETLEAKMASIEVSLSSSALGTPGSGVRRPKRSVASPVSLLSRVVTTPPSGHLVRSAGASPVPPPPSPAPSNRDSAAAARELEALRNALRDKETVIQSLRNQLSNCANSWRPGSVILHQQPHVLSGKERRATEERLAKVRQDMDAKRLAIKNLKLSLERLDITDNIDVRIQQAEAEFQLGREELALLALTEDCRILSARLEESNTMVTTTNVHSQPPCSLHSVVSSAVPSPQKTQGILLTVNLTLDPSNPSFGIARRSDNSTAVSAPIIEWAAQESGLERGDRILEANGRLLLGFQPDELTSILGPSMSTMRLVILRITPLNLINRVAPKDTAALIIKEAAALREELAAARGRLAEQSPETEKVKKERDALKAENLRLSHRISYLEEQVSDLVKDTTPHHVPSVVKHHNGTPPEIHVFQKGSHVTTIVTTLQEASRMSRRADALPPPTPSRSQTPRWHPGDESEGGCSDGRSTRSLDVLHKQRPAPPKKPQRLSLPRAASLQQVDGMPLSEPPRKPSKRSHKGSNVAAAEAVQKAESSGNTLRWSNPAPTCALPTNAQYQNHNQHILNFRRSNINLAGEKWC